VHFDLPGRRHISPPASADQLPVPLNVNVGCILTEPGDLDRRLTYGEWKKKGKTTMKTRVLVLLVLAGLLLPLAACSGASSAPADPLDGTAWVLVFIRKSTPIPDTTVTATFEDGQVHGSAGCNTYSGSYQATDSTITVGAIAITEMFCMEPEGVMDQETMYVQFLQDVQTIRFVDEQLQLSRADREALTFVPCE
jgi:heat shock protein HslJ